MIKVAVLTINDNTNFGNRLQNYAVQVILNKCGVDCNTILNKKNQFGIEGLIRRIRDCLRKILKFNKKNNRYVLFEEFEKNIKYSKIRVGEKNVPKKLGYMYDYFLTGSDQVWNPNFGRMSDIDFLTFAPKEKRNSFSASFGISEIPEGMKEYYKKRLENFNNISVREEKGREIIEELTGRKDVVVLIDPTMMLTSEEWKKVAKKPRKLKKEKKYILNYFLGNLSEERKKEIERIAQENECEIINILDKNDPFYVSGPSEFLYLEEHAFLICTDSFHSSVFAILYDRPFIVFNREDREVSMNSRIENLIEKFELDNRTFNGKFITEKNLSHNYERAYKILEEERRKTYSFLEEVLDIKESE